ncbi:zinc finger BED domain-containing protein RICESLEEPER 2-like protein [Tanacetum coccineum]
MFSLIASLHVKDVGYISSIEISDEPQVEVKSGKKNKGKQPKTRKKRSKVWIDFKQQDLLKGESLEDVKAKCLHCGNLYLCHTRKHGISNLKNHLLKCKPYLAKQSESQTNIILEGGDVNKMMAWKFDQKKSKRALAHMIVVDELPFSFVHNSGFRHYQKINQPLFDVPCRGTITQECLKMYREEKCKLREIVKKNIGRGVDIGKEIESCLNEWEFDNILSISVDNASSNDGAIEFMKMILEKKSNCLLRGKWLHIRCAAHVINLIVQDGMKKVDKSIEGIRCAVKWIKKSGSRIEKFTKCAQSARCDSTKSLVLDCPTRWNSTYNMLEVAHVYEDAFARYDIEEVEFGNHIRRKGHSVPTTDDWTKAKKLCHFLKTFYEITLRISGTKYVTTHTLVNELATIRALLRKQLDCDIHDEPPMDLHLYDIAKVMKPKFDKYYCEVENMNLLVYFVFILDPRNKYDFLHVIVDDHYEREGLSVVTKKVAYIEGEMKLFYEEYVRIHAPSSTSSSSTLGKRQRTTNISDEPDHGDMLRSKMKNGPSSNSSSSELDKYVGETLEPFDKNVHFDILLWSSMGDKMIECLICTQDWLRISLNLEKSEDLDIIAEMEKELMEQEGASSKQD